MRALSVVLDAPVLDHAARVCEAQEPVLVETLVPKLAVEAFDVRVLVRLAGSDEGKLDGSSIRPFVSTWPSNSGPLSTVIDSGKPRVSASRSSTACTRKPVMDVSTSMAKHSRVQSSTMFRQRRRRPPMSPSATKSIDQLTFAQNRLRQRLTLDNADPLAFAPTYGQSRMPIKAVDAFAVDLPAFTSQPQIHQPIPVAALYRGNLLDSRSQWRIVRTTTAIHVQRSRDPPPARRHASRRSCARSSTRRPLRAWPAGSQFSV